MAEALLDSVFGRGQLRGAGNLPGKALEYKEYEPLYKFVQPAGEVLVCYLRRVCYFKRRHRRCAL